MPIETVLDKLLNRHDVNRSIHPQGWVPIETRGDSDAGAGETPCSIHPQGWVPIETRLLPRVNWNNAYE